MSQQEIWVVVANESKARFFKAKTIGDLEEIHTLVHPGSRLTTRELVSDKQSTVFDSLPGSEGRHHSEPKMNPKKREITHFVKEVASFLDMSYKAGKFTTLYLSAAPGFLGMLRKEFSGHVKKTISEELNKDIVMEDKKTIASHFNIIHR